MGNCQLDTISIALENAYAGRLRRAYSLKLMSNASTEWVSLPTEM